MSGFTKIDNWLFDEVMPNAKPNTFKVVMAVARLTVGWGKSTDKISLSQMKKITGIGGFSTLTTAIEDALNCEYIMRETNGDGYQYRLSPTPKTGEGYSQNGSSATPKTGEVATPKTGDTKEIYKDIVKDSEITTDKIGELAKYFQAKTGLFYDPNQYEKNWEPVLKLWYDHYGGDTKNKIDQALRVARGENETGKKYTIKNPAALSTILSNLSNDQKNGVLEVSYR